MNQNARKSSAVVLMNQNARKSSRLLEFEMKSHRFVALDSVFDLRGSFGCGPLYLLLLWSPGKWRPVYVITCVLHGFCVGCPSGISLVFISLFRSQGVLFLYRVCFLFVSWVVSFHCGGVLVYCNLVINDMWVWVVCLHSDFLFSPSCELDVCYLFLLLGIWYSFPYLDISYRSTELVFFYLSVWWLWFREDLR